jgi:hypothetical protein
LLRGTFCYHGAMRISGAIFALALAASACAAVASCRAPTQVQLILKTDVPCQQLNGVIINVGSDAVVLENQLGGYFDAEVDLTKCQADGTLGTIYLAPGSDRGVVLVRAGYGTKQAVQCGPPLYKDCIVARRRFSYVDNITLTLTVKLDPDCLNVPCGALSTCASGKCIESFVSSCKDNACEPDPLARRPQDESDAGPGDAGSPDGSVDAGFTPTDASVPPDDSSTDASSTDGDVADAPGPDGATDAGQSEGGPDAGGPLMVALRGAFSAVSSLAKTQPTTPPRQWDVWGGAVAPSSLPSRGAFANRLPARLLQRHAPTTFSAMTPPIVPGRNVLSSGSRDWDKNRSATTSSRSVAIQWWSATSGRSALAVKRFAPTGPRASRS